MFKKILVGLLISYSGGLISIPIQQLPDGEIISGIIATIVLFVGFIIVYCGLKEISNMHPKFNAAKNLVLAYLIISIPLSAFNFIELVDEMYHMLLTTFTLLIAIPCVVLHVLFLYNLFIGIHELAVKQDYKQLASRSKKTWILNVACLVSAVGIIFSVIIGAILITFMPPLALLFLMFFLCVIFGVIVLVITTIVFEILTLSDASHLLTSVNNENNSDLIDEHLQGYERYNINT